MAIGRYELTRQRRAGPGGVAYEGRDPDGAGPIELRTLASADSSFSKRLRLAAMLSHRSVLPVTLIDTNHQPPFFVVADPGETSLADGFEIVKTGVDVLHIGAAIAGALEESHRLGLVHGRLQPSAVWMPNAALLDFGDINDGRKSLPEFESTIRSARSSAGAGPAPEDDIFGLGLILYWLITGKLRSPVIGEESISIPARGDLGGPEFTRAVPKLEHILSSMLAADASRRPLAGKVARSFARLLEMPTDPALDRTAINPASDEWEAADTDVVESEAAPIQLGRFRILERLGKGGMGIVYRGEDTVDGTIVAIKTITRGRASNETMRRRFLKEARMLAHLNNPWVTRLIEANQDQGTLYLAMEFVDGESVADRLKKDGEFDESFAVGVMCDVARGLSEAHDRGIVHRDVKPDNVLLVKSKPSATAETVDLASVPVNWQAKVADFGLAREVEQSDSLSLTQEGATLGTPLYMAPEQCAGTGVIDARTDVYAMGATLFHLLAGRPPFESTDVVRLMAMHLNEPPPGLVSIRPELSDGIARITAKALAKSPNDRYQTAGELLDDLDRLLRGEPTSINVHPQLPSQSAEEAFLDFEFSWQLNSSPADLWAHVSNTDRFNRAIGLPPATFRTEVDPVSGVRRFGEAKVAGMWIRWEEHPFEWVEGKRFGVLREFSHGPYYWFISTTELTQRSDGGTTLTHSFRIQPRGLLGRIATKLQMGRQTQRSLEKVYRRIDRIVGGGDSENIADPFEPPPRLPAVSASRLEERLSNLAERGFDPELLEKLGRFLMEAPEPDVARIRPIALAHRLGVDSEQLISACLLGVQLGILNLLWDVLCPTCRVPSNVRDSLKELAEHEHCEACNIDFDADFSQSVELIFRVHPELRPVKTGTYCIGGPGNFPHVAAQSRIRSGERIELALAMEPGVFRISSPQLSQAIPLRVERDGEISRLELSLGQGLIDAPQSFRPGRQTVIVSNDAPNEMLIRIERVAGRDDALTASQASSLSLFRDLFPNEVMAPGRLANVTRVTLLAATIGPLDQIYHDEGDSGAFAVLHECLAMIDQHVRQVGGAVVKIVGDGVLATFDDPADAVRFALSLPKRLAASETTGDLSIRLGLHCGEAMLTTINDRLDYFGRTVNAASELLRIADQNELMMTHAIASDPGVAEVVAESGRQPQIVSTPDSLRGLVVHRLKLA